MRLTDIPTYHDVIKHYAERLESEDTDIALAQMKTLQAGQHTTPCPVGMVLYKTHKNDQNENSLWIHLDEGYFAARYPLDSDRLPLASLVKLTDGQVRILINQRTRNLALNPATHSIAVGLAIHELGHELLGHTKSLLGQTSVLVVPNNAQIDFEQAVRTRLSGMAPENDELAVDCCAVGLTDLATVIGYLTYQAAFSYALGVRMEFQNRIHRLLDIADTAPERFQTSAELCAVSILSDAEIQDLQKLEMTEDE